MKYVVVQQHSIQLFSSGCKASLIQDNKTTQTVNLFPTAPIKPYSQPTYQLPQPIQKEGTKTTYWSRYHDLAQLYGRADIFVSRAVSLVNALWFGGYGWLWLTTIHDDFVSYSMTDCRQWLTICCYYCAVWVLLFVIHDSYYFWINCGTLLN